MSIAARRSPLSFIHPLALRACFFLLSHLLSAVSCQSSTIGARLDDASPEVVFTPSTCNHGQRVSADQLPDLCNDSWFITSDEHNETSHATRSSSSRAVLQFEGFGISWFSAPVSQVRGTAYVYLDDVRLDLVQLSPNNTGPDTPAWSKTGLDPYSVHNLTIVPLGDDMVTVDSFALILSQNTSSNPPVSASPVTVAASESGPAAQKDASSGTVISVASIGSVALVVVVCGGCFFLGKRRKSPGFHMPTVLVDIESALDQPDPPSPTTIRAWRESTQKSMAAAAAAGEPTHDRYPPSGASCSRPPSYRSGKDSLYRSDSSSQSHEGHWQ